MPALSQASEIRVVMPLQGTFSVAFPGVDALNVCVPFYDGTNSWNFYQDRIEHNGKKLIFGGQATTDGTGHYTINDAGITATTSLMIQPTGATLVNYLITSQGAGSAVVYTNSPNIPFNWLAFNA
ncbi:MAG TPA: hypothetical protein VMQ76_10735 [Terracidiphilus sp.]|jgi:hypothetical protein|nr:hypothetical protein [Terracidiphilus sp.]